MAVDYRTLNQNFVTEGRFIALPLSVWDECRPIAPDACYVRVLLESPLTGWVYGATTGTACHLFVTASRGASGGTLDLGTLPYAADAVSLQVMPSKTEKHEELLIGANGPDGCALFGASVTFPGDVVQEPSFRQPEIALLWEAHDLQWMGAATVSPDGALFLTDKGVVLWDPVAGEMSVCCELDETEAPFSLCGTRGSELGLIWLDREGALRGFTPDSENLYTLPGCLSEPEQVAAIADYHAGAVIADSDGGIHWARFDSGSCREVARTVLPDVQCMTALSDGRVYGVCGNGIGHFFRVDVEQHVSHDLGAIVSVVGTKRYGLEFSCAITGVQGDIYLGERDRGGHLWLYQPPLA